MFKILLELDGAFVVVVVVVISVVVVVIISEELLESELELEFVGPEEPLLPPPPPEERLLLPDKHLFDVGAPPDGSLEHVPPPLQIPPFFSQLSSVSPEVEKSVQSPSKQQ